jgi:HEAT repeat protein
MNLQLPATADLPQFGSSAAGELTALGDADPTVRRVAAESKRVINLHSAEVTAAIDGWVEDLTSADAAVRYSAAEALGGTGPRAALAGPALTRLLNDADEVVRGAARTALRNIRTHVSTATENTRSKSAP